MRVLNSEVIREASVGESRQRLGRFSEGTEYKGIFCRCGRNPEPPDSKDDGGFCVLWRPRRTHP